MTLRSSLASLLGPIRHGPARVLHPTRRRRALSRLARLRAPRAVLFLCHGNICRSPYAAAAFARALGPGGEGVRVASAGFFGPDRPPPPEAAAAAADRGVNLSGHRSRLLNQTSLRSADLVVVMDAAQRHAIRRRYGRAPEVIVLGDVDPGPIGGRGIPDPVLRPREVFDRVYDRIDRCVGELARALLGSGSGRS